MGQISTESKEMLLHLAATMALRAIESADRVTADQLKIHDDQRVEELEFHIDVVVTTVDRTVSITARPKDGGQGMVMAMIGMTHIDTLQIEVPWEWIPGWEGGYGDDDDPSEAT